MKSLFYFCLAAVFEIAGCFSLWAWLREKKSAWLLLPGCVSLLLFGYLLTKVDAAFAGRAYAAYGGIYIVASVLWLWAVEKVTPNVSDIVGAGLCLAGTCVIMFAQRAP